MARILRPQEKDLRLTEFIDGLRANPDQFANAGDGVQHQLVLGQNVIFTRSSIPNGTTSEDLRHGVLKATALGNPDGNELADWIELNSARITAIMEGAGSLYADDWDVRVPNWSEAAIVAFYALARGLECTQLRQLQTSSWEDQ